MTKRKGKSSTPGEPPDFSKEGFTVRRCFPDSFRPIHAFQQSSDEPTEADRAAWEDYNIGLEINKPDGFALLMFDSLGEYDRAIVKEPALAKLTAVRNPDYSVVIWFTTKKELYNCHIESLDANIICRGYIVPAPPARVGIYEAKFIKQASPLLKTWDPPIKGSKPVIVRPYSMAAIPLRGMMAFQGADLPAYIGGGVLDAQGKLMIAGIPKAGKSRLAINLAFSLVTGRSFLGQQTFGHPRTLMLQFEVSERRFQERINGVARAWKIPPDTELPLFFLTLRALRLDTPKGVFEFRKLIKAFRAEVVILDPMVKIHTSNESELQEMTGLLNILDDMIDELGIAIILIHHFNKRDVGESWTRIRGSSHITGWVDSFLMLDRPNQEAKPTVSAVLRNGDDWQRAIQFNENHTVKVLGTVDEAIKASIEETFWGDPTISRKELAATISRIYNTDLQEVYGIMKSMENTGTSLPK